MKVQFISVSEEEALKIPPPSNISEFLMKEQPLNTGDPPRQ
jgi:hypothetical protein